jgi:hypothetical protein
MTIALQLLGPALGSLAFFGGIGFLFWLEQRGKTERRRVEHVERMKAIELGQPLYDKRIAWAETEAARVKAVGAIGVSVALASFSAAAIATGIVFASSSSESRLSLLLVLWVMCSLAGLLGPAVCVWVLRRPRPRRARQARGDGAKSVRRTVRGSS